MTLYNQDLTIIAGTSWNQPFSVVDKDNVPVDLNGALLTWVLRFNTAQGTLAVQHDNDSIGGVYVTDATAGTGMVIMETEDTIQLQGTYYHELKVVTAGSQVGSPFCGNWTILPTGIK